MKKVLLKDAADFAKVRDESFYGDTSYDNEAEPRSYPAMAVVAEAYEDDYCNRYIFFVYPADFT